MEPRETRRDELGAELDRIEDAVDGGATDLTELGFWRLVGRVKRAPDLIGRHADQIGRIDAKAFRAAPLIRVPLGFGLSLMAAAVALGVVALVVAFRAAAGHDPGRITAGVALIMTGGAWAAGLHSLTHYLVGIAVGIRFTDAFGSVPPPPLPGLKTDYASYLRASPTARIWMHASGAVATKLAPFIALGFAPAVRAPWWAVAILLALGLLQISTDLLFSTKASDWKKVRRELAVARDLRTS